MVSRVRFNSFRASSTALIDNRGCVFLVQDADLSFTNRVELRLQGHDVYEQNRQCSEGTPAISGSTVQWMGAAQFARSAHMDLSQLDLFAP
jgi:hypothetical protein